MKSKEKTIEEKFQKLTQIEHVKKRPGMYIGDIKNVTEEQWCWDNSENKMIKKFVSFTPAFLKIFDEVLTNATDHAARDDTVSSIKVDFDEITGEISVWNNGSGIPVVIHKEHNIYVPELIFGHMLSGSSYNDNETRTGAGTNGIGSKCVLHSTPIPLFNGEIKQASEIKIGDVLIGDDGNPRNVLSVISGKGKMYEISQNWGESYKVNDEHILTLQFTDHKVISWCKNGWQTSWWDFNTNTIKYKFIKAINENIECDECGIILNSNLKRHYSRKHKNIKLPIKIRNSKKDKLNMNDENILKTLNSMKDFIFNIDDNNIIDISIKDYLKLPKYIKESLAGVRAKCVNWEYKDIELDPYVLGLWLGDGYSNGYGYSCNGEKDYHIINYLKEWGLKNDAKFSNNTKYAYILSSIENYKKSGMSPLKKILEKYNLINNKHIPKEYLINSRDVRLKLLAGLIDTDGTVSRDGTRIAISQGLQHKVLIYDILYLARSLGFNCSIRTGKAKYKNKGIIIEKAAYFLNISGNVDDIPTLLPRKKCRKPKKQNTDKSTGQIKVKEVNETNYVGIHIDGNERFIINDFTVTHNCTNIFSKKFIVETIDSENGLKFIQEYTDGLENKSKPKVTKNSGKSYTKITFIPDYNKFSMKKLDKDTVSLLIKRVYDCIACTNKNVSVFLNGEKLKGKGLVDYAKYFFDEESGTTPFFTDSITQKVGKNEFIWEYIIVPYSQFEQVSFVNGNSTYNGGKHVDHVMYQIVNKLKTLLETKKKLKDIKPAMIRERMFLFLRSTVANPQFNSQTKECLTTQVKDFGCKIEVNDKFIDKLWKSQIIEDIVQYHKLKETMDIAKKTDGSKKNKVYIPKLEDALWAGTNKSEQCTLILTEGESAKTFAMWGRSIVGPEKFGVMPLRGKLLNLRDATAQQLVGNEEINNVKQIVGLKQGKEYKDTSELRYGKIIILTDADCVTGDTPLLVRDKNNNILTETIERLTDNFTRDVCTNKEFGNTDLEIWTEKGWSKINSIMRHKVSKTFYRVLTHTGVIDVSEDHPLLTSEKIEKTAKKCLINDKLLHSFPIFNENKIDIPENAEKFRLKDASKCKIPYYQSYKKNDLILELDIMKEQPVISLNNLNFINKDEAYVMGLFWADGTSGVYKWKYDYKAKNRPNKYTYNRITYSWSISNNNVLFLQKAKQILEKLYNLEFKIIECNTLRINKSYKLIINGGIKTKDIVEKYTSLFYYSNPCKYKNGNKYIPKEILNATTQIREQFLIGFYNGDGYGHDINKQKELKFDVESKISAQCLFILCKSLGYEVSINIIENKPNIISLTLTKGHQQWDKNKIKKIINLGKIDSYVYDLETENHHFQAGVGQMIVHNCDGSHIKSLFVNFIHAQWPSLIKLNFLQTLRTPIVKAIKGKNVIEFFTEQDYNKWKETANVNSFQIKYFKGLGTSRKEDAQNSFKNLDSLLVDYYYKDQKCDESILLAFEKDKNIKTTKTKTEDLTSETSENGTLVTSTATATIKCSDKRKQWLGTYDKNSYIDSKQKKVSYQDLINKELIHFSIYDNMRSIPSLCDGLKPSQRKILHYMLKKDITKDIKVAQLSGYVSAETSYHHGEASLQQAIIGMAQDFTSSNNINVLYPNGNFGSRYGGGKDAASPRYIYTRLSNVTKSIFHKDDSRLLNYLNDDGTIIEPEWFIPIIPMILVNGCEGIGTGYSTFIPPYNPKEIIENINRIIDEKQPLEMKPYFKGFNGIIQETTPGTFVSKGKWEKLSDTQIKITELPIGMWVTTYKEFLESLIPETGNGKKKTEKKKPTKSFELKDVQNKTTDENSNIVFIVEFKNSADLNKLIKNGTLEKELKLCKTFSTNNMYVFDDNLLPTRYASPVDLLLDFYDIRLEFYVKRKKWLVQKLTKELNVLQSKVRFIEEYITGKLDINRKSKDTIISILEEKGYKKFGKIDFEEIENTENDSNLCNYDYLIKMPLVSLSLEKIEELNKQTNSKNAELNDILNKTEKDLWKQDLDEILKQLN
jgi:DNA gyrase/topoisomerase IV subunit B